MTAAEAEAEWRAAVEAGEAAIKAHNKTTAAVRTTNQKVIRAYRALNDALDTPAESG